MSRIRLTIAIGLVAPIASAVASPIDDDPAALFDPVAARDYHELGLLHEKADRYDEAVDAYSKAMALDPTLFDAAFSRANLHEELGDHRRAIDDYGLALEARPGDISALHNRAMNYERIGDYDAAIAGYTDIIDGGVNHQFYGGTVEEALAHAYAYRGRVYAWRRRDYEKAVADYSKALELDPEIHNGFMRRGRAYHHLGRYAEAEADYEAALERAPDYSVLRNRFAWQLATCPDPGFRDGAHAVELARATIEKAGWDDPEYLDTLAAALAERGDFEEAARRQEEAIAHLDGDRYDSPEARQAMGARLELYRAGRPFREEEPTTLLNR